MFVPNHARMLVKVLRKPPVSWDTAIGQTLRCFSLRRDRSISTPNSQRISQASRVQWKCLPQPQASIQLNLAGVDE